MTLRQTDAELIASVRERLLQPCVFTSDIDRLTALCDRLEAALAALELWARFVVTTSERDMNRALDATIAIMDPKPPEPQP